MSNYKTYKKEKRLYFAFSVIGYFLPFTVVTACLLPFLKEAEGVKIAVGLGVVAINAIPFLVGVFRWFFSHFPMLNFVALLFLALSAFFRMDIFSAYADTFLWIELAAGIGSILSCVLWAKYLKYAEASRTMKYTVKSGAFKMREDKE